MPTPESYQTPTSQVEFMVTQIDTPAPWPDMQQTYPGEQQQIRRREPASSLLTQDQRDLRFAQIGTGVSSGSFLFSSVFYGVTHQLVLAALTGAGAIGFWGFNRFVSARLHENERRNVIPQDQKRQ